MKNILKTKEFWLGMSIGMTFFFVLFGLMAMLYYLTGFIQ